MQSRLMHLNGAGGRDRGQSSRASGGGRERGSSELRKGRWTENEDKILLEYVRKNGARNWSSIQCQGLLLRDSKSCRFRWVNQLRDDLPRVRGKLSEEEVRLVMELQEQWGNKWARIATQLPGRTENDVKNFWGSTRWKQLTGIASDLNHRQNSAHSQPLPPPPQAQNAYASHILIQDSFTDDPLPQFDGVVDEYLGPRFMNYSPPRLKLDELPWSLDNCSPPMLELDELACLLDNFDEPPPPPTKQLHCGGSESDDYRLINCKWLRFWDRRDLITCGAAYHASHRLLPEEPRFFGVMRSVQETALPWPLDNFDELPHDMFDFMEQPPPPPTTHSY
ncbi:transcription factor MYB10-like [Zingiber officinale]|uniref:transcription factor MYB10-like n=1 Tax=Zingiber officinale TaxID=94328 RepID=UPI001C4CA95E|nr:transcription factor MYB10-like [Zingiber officinale]